MKEKTKDILIYQKCKQIIDTSKIFTINKVDQYYMKEYLIPLINKKIEELKKD